MKNQELAEKVDALRDCITILRDCVTNGHKWSVRIDDFDNFDNKESVFVDFVCSRCGGKKHIFVSSRYDFFLFRKLRNNLKGVLGKNPDNFDGVKNEGNNRRSSNGF